MFKGYKNTEELTQNLMDAGCDSNMIASFISCLKHGDKAGGLWHLSEQRGKLLDEIHKEKAGIDFLDALLLDLRG